MPAYNYINPAFKAFAMIYYVILCYVNDTAFRSYETFIFSILHSCFLNSSP